MKKKLLVGLLVCILTCLFALTVSAANEVTLVGGDKVDFETVFNVNSNNVVTGYKTGYNSNSVTDVTFPDYLVGIESNGLFGKYANPASTTIKTLTFAATDTFFINGDNIFSGCSVEKVTFNPNCVVEIRKGNFSGCTKLTEITFPKFSKLAGSSFAECSNMVSTNELIFAEGMTEIGGHAFRGCTSLTGTVYFPSTLEKIQEYSFQKTGFTYFDLSKCASLTAVGGGYGGPFNDNDKITTLDLSGCTSLTALKSSFAQGCDSLTKVILPPSLTEIPHKAFAHCYKLQSIVLPESVTYVADEAFHSARHGEIVKTFTVYLQGNTVFHGSYPFRDSHAKIEFVLIGEGMTAADFIAANTFSGITGATVVNYKDGYNYTVGQAITNHTIVENYCSTLALTGEHASGENPCVILCADCLLSAPKENPEHNLDTIIFYENGFDAKGTKITVCLSDGCEYKEETEARALFISLGYSVAEEGAGGIDIGYKVDREAVAEYEKVIGVDISFGVFAGLQSVISENDIFNESKEALNGVISADMTDTEYSIFRIKMYGFAGEQLNTVFAMGAYVCIDNGTSSEYQYLQISAPSENSKYYYASYNDILKL